MESILQFFYSNKEAIFIIALTIFLGLEVISAGTGEEGITLAESRLPDVVSTTALKFETCSPPWQPTRYSLDTGAAAARWQYCPD